MKHLPSAATAPTFTLPRAGPQLNALGILSLAAIRVACESADSTSRTLATLPLPRSQLAPSPQHQCSPCSFLIHLALISFRVWRRDFRALPESWKRLGKVLVDIGMGLCIEAALRCGSRSRKNPLAILAVCLKSVTPLFAQHGIVNLHHASAQAALRCRAIAVLQWRLRTSLAQRTMGPKTRSSNESIASRGSHSSRNLGDRQRDSQRRVTDSRQTTAGLGSPTPREAPDLREPQLEPRGRRQDVRRTALTD